MEGLPETESWPEPPGPDTVDRRPRARRVEDCMARGASLQGGKRQGQRSLNTPAFLALPQVVFGFLL